MTFPSMVPPMDWFSWLSRTNLEPSLVYEYGLAFARNELQSEDLAYFNHEFLQSMGISVAKHRLEILKLARKEIGSGPRTLSGLIMAINKTRRRLNKYISKWVSHDGPPAIKAAPPLPSPEPDRYREQWKGALLRNFKSEKDLTVQNQDDGKKQKKRIALSGPLNGKVQERMMGNTRSLKLSGPLDGKVQERLFLTDRSPRLSGPLDGRLPELRLSGPLDGKLLLTNRSPRFSGPLDGRMQEKFMMPIISPKLYGPLDGRAVSPMGYNYQNGNGDYEDHLIWAALFEDLKPT